MVKVPRVKKLKCGPYTWTEQWVDRDDERLGGDDGRVNFQTKEIVLAADLLENEDEAVLAALHERLHAAWYSFGAPGESGGRVGEALVEALSRGLLQTFRGKLKVRNM